MKRIIITSCLLLSLAMSAQQKFFTKTGLTEFKASVEAFEPVEAKNNSTTAILNTSNGDIAALLFVKAFHFKVALMQEHFNENYMDSDKFPKATFKGNIQNFNMDNLSETNSEFTIKGTLNVRGKDKSIEAKSTLKKVNEMIVLIANFSVTPQDFGIDIPKIVRKKIAETINVTLHYELVEKK